MISRSVLPRNAIRNASAANSGSFNPVLVFISQTLFREEQASHRPSSENRISSGGLADSTGWKSGSSLPHLNNRNSDIELTASSWPSADRANRGISVGKI